jgi:hypothetical protein
MLLAVRPGFWWASPAQDMQSARRCLDGWPAVGIVLAQSAAMPPRWPCPASVTFAGDIASRPQPPYRSTARSPAGEFSHC